VAITNGRDGGTTEEARVVPFDGDDIAVVPAPTRPPGGPRRRTIALVVIAATVVVVAVTAAIIASRHSSPSSVRTITPAARVAVPATPNTEKRSSATSVHTESTAAPTPTLPIAPPPAGSPTPASENASIGTTAANAAPTTAAAQPAPPAPPTLLGPNVLVFTVMPGRDITIPPGKTVTLDVTVKNPTASTAYLPTPFTCLATPGIVCAQHTENIASGASEHTTFTLDAKDFGAQTAKVLIGGYYPVKVRVG